ncbi:MAG: flagellar motor switch protein FliN [Acidobacteriota bacterium]|nr:flagellar motor switch protein FliN [Acidobacteriota bacterium]
MTQASGLPGAGAAWLLEQWTEKLSGVIHAMSDQRPSIGCTPAAHEDAGPGALLLQQKVVSVADPVLWIGIPESAWRDLGTLVLSASGVKSSDDEENRNTCFELIEQSTGALTSALAKRTGREISRQPLSVCETLPEGMSAVSATISIGEKTLAPIWMAFAPLLTSWADAQAPEKAPKDAPGASVWPEDAHSAPVSKTFELLLDVSLPVSVSFGKTELAVKDVLKLTTGSIVELNRSVSEPVEVIVNGCVIARGEVVVVEGNYGVRIHHIVSRKERLRTGSGPLPAVSTRIAPQEASADASCKR